MRDIALAITATAPRQVGQVSAVGSTGAIDPAPSNTGLASTVAAPPVLRSAIDEELALRDDVAMALGPQQVKYTEACFDPAKYGRRSYEMQISVDADGNELSRSFVKPADDSSPPLPALEACLRAVKTPRIKIRARGKPVTVTMPFRVP
jgi:hypothetical protein